MYTVVSDDPELEELLDELTELDLLSDDESLLDLDDDAELAAAAEAAAALAVASALGSVTVLFPRNGISITRCNYGSIGIGSIKPNSIKGIKSRLVWMSI